MSNSRHFFSLFVFFSLFILLHSCSTKHKDQAPTFGDLDTGKIAIDTAMQVNMDNSYEYQKSLVQNDSVVFDFLAYDRPKASNNKMWESKFLLIRRTKAGQDTVIKDHRSDKVRSIWISDLDQNGKPEIMFYEYPLASKKLIRLFAYEVESTKKYRVIESDIKEDNNEYRGNDTFFVYQNFLIRKYPVYKLVGDKTAGAEIWESYQLENGRLVLHKSKEVR